MSEKSVGKTTILEQKVGEKASRMLKAQHHSKEGVWFGLGMMGLIGWSVVVPTLLGAVLGHWLDKRHPQIISWTLTCMLLGMLIGCLNAWHWTAKEGKEMQLDEED